ncbi:MAG: hypothetical protein HUJ54_10880 [Erysipelotrichaceae bacterium]|nr:hypothetical protein [Erysipelotrichaceae bacterium]
MMKNTIKKTAISIAAGLMMITAAVPIMAAEAETETQYTVEKAYYDADASGVPFYSGDRGTKADIKNLHPGEYYYLHTFVTTDDCKWDTPFGEIVYGAQTTYPTIRIDSVHINKIVGIVASAKAKITDMETGETRELDLLNAELYEPPHMTCVIAAF